MSINDGTLGDFTNELQDEDQLDAHPPPGVEIGYYTQRDCGSGSYAEDGRRKVREDRPIMDGENILGSAAMYGPTEIGWEDDAVGATKKAVAQAAHAVQKAQVAVKTAPPHVAAKHVAAAHQAVAKAHHVAASGPYASHGPVEIGAGEDTLGTDALTQPFETFMLEPTRLGSHYPSQGAAELGYAPYAAEGASEVGSAAMYGPTEIGTHYPTQGAAELGFAPYAVDGASELGHGLYSEDGASELGAGLYSEDGASELGALYPTNGLSVMGEDDLGAGWYAAEGASDIGEAAQKAAVVKVVEKARDNRQPAPPMKAVDVDAPLDEDEESFISDIVMGATVAAPGAVEPFPLLSQLLLRAGAATEPRIVRVDTEQSYKAWRTAQSPELSKVSELADRVEAHISDPNAHELDSMDIDDDIADLVHLGEEAKAVEAQKRVELWMPSRFDGKVEAWQQDDMICASLALPGRDGEVRICTSFEPVRKCIEEMCRHASETQVPTAAVVGVLPAMGCVLGAGTVMKEVAAAAPAILARPEAQVKMPFVVRIEPKTSPNLAALVMLAAAAKMGNAQAQSEWQKLASMSAPAVKSAMLEAAAVAKAATEV